jgi:transcriptional regulator with XRE-family HTH domain
MIVESQYFSMPYWNALVVDAAIFGARIRQARERIAMSQEQLADAVSKDQRAISEYENGKRKLSATDLPLFARALTVPVSYFYDDEIHINDLERLLLHEFQQLPSTEAKQAAIQIVRIFSTTLKSELH